MRAGARKEGKKARGGKRRGQSGWKSQLQRILRGLEEEGADGSSHARPRPTVGLTVSPTVSRTVGHDGVGPYLEDEVRGLGRVERGGHDGVAAGAQGGHGRGRGGHREAPRLRLLGLG